MFTDHSDIFGIDVGFETFKAVQLVRKLRHFEIWGKVAIPLPENSISKNGIANGDQIAQTIKKFLLQAVPHSIARKTVFAALPESLTFTKIINLPLKNKREIRQALETSTADFLPVSAEEVYLDFLITRKNQTGSEVLILAQPRKLVDDFLEIMKKADLIVSRLETKQIALARLFLAHNSSENVMIIDVGTKVSKISLFEKGILNTTSTIPVGAETIKSEKTMSPLVGAAQKMPLFHKRQTQRSVILQKVLITGHGASLPGLTLAVNEGMKIPVFKAKPHVRITNFDHSFAVATGLALDGFD